MAMIKDLAQVNAELQAEKERANTVDYKMVTFSLAGKDYGVDIMNVKEIAKADKFTYVPNAAAFVRGVYNLRGDIIPIIDLRSFFHLPVDKKADGLENMLILRIEDRVYGTIVDKIDKVVGINTENIQPPHPIFGDINIKYISGVVEKQGALYIILDVVRIFSLKKEEEKVQQRDAAGGAFGGAPGGITQDKIATAAQAAALTDSAIGFIKENLPTLKKFYPGDINDEWIRRRFADWSATRTGDELQLKNENEADEYLSSFYSPDSGRFWSDDYAAMVKSFLPAVNSNNIQVWNIGCGKGYESFSFACILKSRYSGAHIKIWANDSDIMAISQAPNMIFELSEVPEYCQPFLVKGRAGYSFSQELKDSIVFEYHDVLNDNPLPDLDFILARDLLSFLPEEPRFRIVSGFAEKLKSHGIVFLGRNEIMPGNEWGRVADDPVSAFAHNG
ncbi:MAG: chemotaxis protein CheW [Treponema sp.]|jgi:purine-binding chemotaxis protein CheW|nr:chemotaxis protein CheW [Treponema sp.]